MLEIHEVGLVFKMSYIADGKKASSDGDCPDVVGDRSNLQRKKRNKENYEDAFPSLAGSKFLPASTKPFVDSVWSKTETDNSK